MFHKEERETMYIFSQCAYIICMFVYKLVYICSVHTCIHVYVHVYTCTTLHVHVYNWTPYIQYVQCIYSVVEDISRSTDEALNKESVGHTVATGSERRALGHQRSRSEGSTASLAVAAPAKVAGGREAAHQPVKSEREMSPPFRTRQSKGK